MEEDEESKDNVRAFQAVSLSKMERFLRESSTRFFVLPTDVKNRSPSKGQVSIANDLRVEALASMSDAAS